MTTNREESETKEERVDWDALENAGHDFVMVAPYMQGRSRYVCASCGTFMITGGGMGPPTLEVWFHPRRNDRACELPRPTTPEPTLRQLMDALQARDVERLRDI